MTREEAINAITQFIENYAYGNDLIGLKMAIEALKEERPHEEWVRGVRDHYFVQICSGCDKTYRLTKQTAKFNFCPNCGADMRKEGDENEKTKVLY